MQVLAACCPGSAAAAPGAVTGHWSPCRFCLKSPRTSVVGAHVASPCHPIPSQGHPGQQHNSPSAAHLLLQAPLGCERNPGLPRWLWATRHQNTCPSPHDSALDTLHLVPGAAPVPGRKPGLSLTAVVPHECCIWHLAQWAVCRRRGPSVLPISIHADTTHILAPGHTVSGTMAQAQSIDLSKPSAGVGLRCALKLCLQQASGVTHCTPVHAYVVWLHGGRQVLRLGCGVAWTH